MSRPIRRRQEQGFTIVELMIATTVFSVVLLICSFAMLQIGRTYYKGITMARTQTTARTIIDEVSQAIQFSGGSVIPGGDGVCIGNTLYYSPSLPAPAAGTLNKYVFGSNCTSAALPPTPPPLPTPVNMLGSNMRLGKFTVEKISGTTLYQITIRVVYGDALTTADLATTQCLESRAGGQFCAISELSTVVQKRL